MIPDMLLRLAINRLTVLRPHEKQLLEELVDSEAFFRVLTPGLLSQIVGRTIGWMDASGSDLLHAAERDAEYLRARSCRVYAVTDRHYPPALREIFDPPYLLYVRGELPDEHVPAVALVGTRRPTAAASIAARELAGELAAAGLPVVSGLARGIDAAAHEGALVRGITGAVLASGIDMVTPSSSRPVAGVMLDRGGYIVSEYAPGTAPRKYHFPARNRIISGLARGVVIVQAPARSGALITAEYALDQGRDLFVHRDGLGGASGAGGDDLAADGAMIISSADDVLREWGIERDASGEALDRASALTSEYTTLDDAARARVEAMRRAVAREAGT